MKNRNRNSVFIFLTLFSNTIFAQSVTLQQAIEMALKNNPQIKAAVYEVAYTQQLKRTATDVGKTSAIWMHGKYNSWAQDNNITFSQLIPFPTTLYHQNKLGKEQVLGSQKNVLAWQNEIVYQVKSTYEQLQYQREVETLLLSIDSLYKDFSRVSSLRYKTGESNLLEKTTAETQYLEIKNLQQINQADIAISAFQLKALLKTTEPVYNTEKLSQRTLTIIPDSTAISTNPQWGWMKQKVLISERMKKVENSKLMPDISVGYFIQSLTGTQNIGGVDTYFPNNKLSFNGFLLGVSIPLWISPHIARAKAAKVQQEIIRTNSESYETVLRGNYLQALQELHKNEASLSYYETTALKNASLILTQSHKAYKQGEIGYVEYLQSLKTALQIKQDYLQSLTRYNQSVLKIEFLVGKI